MARQLLFQMAAIPPIAKLIQIPLDVDFAEMMEGALEELLGVRYCQADASHLYVLQTFWNVPHL